MGTKRIKRAKPKRRKSYPQSEAFSDPTWECKQCGKCCEYLPFHAGGRDDDHDHFWNTWGCETFAYNNQQYIKIHLPCQHLGEDKKCRIYENRPARCRIARCYPWAGICPDN